MLSALLVSPLERDDDPDRPPRRLIGPSLIMGVAAINVAATVLTLYALH